MEELSKRLQRLRKQAGLTQEEVADRFGISPQAISKWETGASAPDISILVELAEMYRVSVDELLGKDRDKTVVLPPEERKDINLMNVKMHVLSADGDKVDINMPMSVIIACVKSGVEFNIGKNGGALKDVNFKDIISLVESGAIGKLVDITSSDGDTVAISVE